jgi:N-acetylglutamate synthase-like GNAT family acetyltransferase
MIWEIRTATLRDWPEILRLQRTGNRPRRTRSSPPEYIVAMVADEMVGCIGARCADRIGYIYGLVVGKNWRRKGIGHFLTQTCIDGLRKAGVTEVFVLSMFWNIRFFKKHGFALVQRSSFSHLVTVHDDFSQKWGSRSALLYLAL